MMKKWFGLLPAAALILNLLFTACLTKPESRAALIPGQVTVQVRGHEWITMTVIADMSTDPYRITDVRFEHHETDGYGAAVIQGANGKPSAKEIILEDQRFDTLVNVVSGATLTRNAIGRGGAEALRKLEAGDFDTK